MSHNIDKLIFFWRRRIAKFGFLLDACNMVSSANRDNLTWLTVEKSFMYKMCRSGKRHYSWGILALMTLVVESCSITLTENIHSNRKEKISLDRLSGAPLKNILCTRPSCHTLLNAFFMSRKIAAVWTLLFLFIAGCLKGSRVR